jgi:hypothetical protein
MTSRPLADRLPRRLLLIALVALALRVMLVFSGGQFYWPDENRYGQAVEMLEELSHAQIQRVALRLSDADHPLFNVFALVPAFLQKHFGQSPRIPGVYFAVYSVGSILLIGLIARRLGSPPGEALLASVLLAASSSFFYFARHVVPYDVAMMLDLAALYVGARPGDRLTASAWCGVLAGCAFLTYTGYWTLSAVAVLIHVVLAPSLPQAMRRGVVAAAGLATPAAVVMAITLPFGGNLARSLASFSHAVTQGEFAEGWRLPWEYLWHAEHGLLVVWTVGTVCALVLIRRISTTSKAALLGIATVYGVLAFTSTILHKFVVYGRLSRQIVPLLCLATAGALWSLRDSVSVRFRVAFMGVVVALVVVQAAFNMTTVFRVTFPREFLREALSDPRVTSPDDLFPINVGHIYPSPTTVQLPDEFIVLRRTPHPLQFLPYQYEGYTPAERAVLRSRDINMTLLLVPHR